MGRLFSRHLPSCVNRLTERRRADRHAVPKMILDSDPINEETVMFGTFDSIRNAAAEVFTKILFAATAAIIVGGTAAMCLEPSVLFA